MKIRRDLSVALHFYNSLFGNEESYGNKNRINWNYCGKSGIN